jgi:hypothetical protein
MKKKLRITATGMLVRIVDQTGDDNGSRVVWQSRSEDTSYQALMVCPPRDPKAEPMKKGASRCAL